MMDAALAAGVSWHTVHRRRDDDPEFEAQFEEARRKFADKFLKHADDLCLTGIRNPVFFEGQKCGEKVEYPIPLIQMRLRSLFPEMRERQEVDLNMRGGVLVVPATATPTEWEKTFGAVKIGAPPDNPEGSKK